MRADQLRDVERITVDAGSSCGLKFLAVDYQGATWMFDPANLDEAHPDWARDGVDIQVGRFGAGVWAIAPDGSSYRLVRVEQASLLLLVVGESGVGRLARQPNEHGVP